jgi:hypothetical protein
MIFMGFKKQEWFHKNCIDWSTKGQFTVFNYRQDAKDKFDALDRAYEKFRHYVECSVKAWQYDVEICGLTKKDLALRVLEEEPHWLHQFIFRLYDKPWDDKNLWEMLVKRLPDVMAVERLLKPEVESI